MPKFEVRKPADVPQPTRASRAVRAQQQQYEEFIRKIDGNVGELELTPPEQIRSVKVRLRRAATRLGVDLEIWDANGRVYFRTASGRRRARKS